MLLAKGAKSRVLCLGAALCAASSVSAKNLYQTDTGTVKGRLVTASSEDLCAVADSTLQYLAKGETYDPVANKAGNLADFGVTFEQVKQTLSFICEVQKADAASGGPDRLADPAFLRKHFDWYRWKPNRSQAEPFAANKRLLRELPEDKILLTRYYIKLAQGSPGKTADTPHALYSLPVDERELSFVEAEEKKDSLIRYRYTKHEVLSGILDKNHWAEPLLWLSRADLEDTLMQGTVKVDVADGARFFNVHRNNGIGYDRGIKKEQQKRYWYFKETPGPLGYGKDADYKIRVRPYVTVAGDIRHFGLGKLVMLSHEGEHRLTILADTGGAFEQNQYQLDYLGGYFKNFGDYAKAYRDFADYFEARFLVLKPGVTAKL